MIDFATARQIATEEINKYYTGEFAPLVVLDEQTIEKEYGWVFFYSTQRYAETRDFRYALAGNGPVIVEKVTGSVHRFGSSKFPEEIIRLFEMEHGYAK